MKKIILIIFLTIPALLPLFHYGFFPTHDSVHVPRVYEMDRGLVDGQFPVRWTPDVRYGEATFNFYAPLPYYVGAGIHHLGLSYIDSVKVLIALGVIMSALGMFLLIREFYGDFAGVVSAAFYTYAPYHSVDIYVRGALPESIALVFLPLIFWSIYKGKIVLIALSVGGLLLTHNVMSLMFFPFCVAWSLFVFWHNKWNVKFLTTIVLGAILGLGIASFFVLPAYFEKDLVQNKYLTTGYFDYRGHFVGIGQFFKPIWGYESSVFGTEDKLSFQLGLVHWAAVLFSIVLLLGQLIKKKLKDVKTYILILALVLLLGSLFVQHNQSEFIWSFFPIMAYIQFPWRFLGISIFLASIISGAVFASFKYKPIFFGIVAVILVVIVNFNYFQPRIYEPLTDKDYIADEILASKDRTPKDYLPNNVRDVKNRVVNNVASTSDYKANNFQKGSDWARFEVHVMRSSHISVPIYYFPNWEVYVDGSKISQTAPNDQGWISFNILPGDHSVYLKFENTPIRTTADIISLLSIVLIIALGLWKNKLWLKK